jgi:hypothetical protein
VLPKVRRFIEADLSHQHDLPFRLFPKNNYKAVGGNVVAASDTSGDFIVAFNNATTTSTTNANSLFRQLHYHAAA